MEEFKTSEKRVDIFNKIVNQVNKDRKAFNAREKANEYSSISYAKNVLKVYQKVINTNLKNKSINRKITIEELSNQFYYNRFYIMKL